MMFESSSLSDADWLLYRIILIEESAMQCDSYCSKRLFKFQRRSCISSLFDENIRMTIIFSARKWHFLPPVMALRGKVIGKVNIIALPSTKNPTFVGSERFELAEAIAILLYLVDLKDKE